jgi:hypothetical protein
MREEIKRRLNSGNACYHSVQKILSSRLLSKIVKIGIYRSIGRSLCRLTRLLSMWCPAAAFFSSNVYGVHSAGLSDFSVRGAPRRNFSLPMYTVFIVQAYQTSQYVMPRGGIFLFQCIRCSLCRLIRLLSTWCPAAAYFSSNVHGVHCAGFSVCGAAR